MTKTIRKQFYIEPDLDARLRTHAMSLGISQAELVRLAIGAYLDARIQKIHSPNRNGLTEEIQFMKSLRPAEGGVPFKWNREEMYEEILAERGLTG